MNNYQGYLFDWDGTLAKTLEEWLNVLRETYLAYGIDVSDETIVTGFGNWRAIIDFGLAEEHYAAYRQDIEKNSHVVLSKAPLYPGARELLEQLKQDGKKLGLVTSSMIKVIQAVLEYHKLDSIFDVVITGDDVANYKPHPECVEKALEKLELSSRDVVMIGDSDKDLGVANAAKTDSILYYPDSHKLFYKLEELQEFNPTYIISDWSELQ